MRAWVVAASGLKRLTRRPLRLRRYGAGGLPVLPAESTVSPESAVAAEDGGGGPVLRTLRARSWGRGRVRGTVAEEQPALSFAGLVRQLRAGAGLTQEE